MTTKTTAQKIAQAEADMRHLIATGASDKIVMMQGELIARLRKNA